MFLWRCSFVFRCIWLKVSTLRIQVINQVSILIKLTNIHIQKSGDGRAIYDALQLNDGENATGVQIQNSLKCGLLKSSLQLVSNDDLVEINGRR